MSRFSIIVVLISFSALLNAQKIQVDIHDNAAYFTENNDSIMVYQIADKSIDGAYARSNYIHPLYTLNGEVLTEDFPADHLHHRGVFWAWHQLYIGDVRIGDGWDIKDIRWEMKSVNLIDSQEQTKTMQTEVLWKSPLWLDEDGREKAVIREVSSIKVYPATEVYRQIDFEIALYALEDSMRLGGSENEKGYGGFSARIRLPEDIKFTSSNGNVTPDNLPVHAGGWMDFSGSLGKEGNISGISILSHPDNPAYPTPWILRAKESLQNAVYPFPGADAVPLCKSKPTLLRYRLLIHKGDTNELDIPTIHEKYGKN